MSKRRILAVVLAASGALVGCSGDSPSSTSGDIPSSSGTTTGAMTSGGTSGTSGTASSSSGTSGMSSSGSSGTSGTSGGNPIATCVAACEAKYPQGAVIGKGIDACWSQKCPMQCDGIGTGQPKPPNNGSCKNVVSTPSSACSQCTVDKCCTAWDACFDNQQCAALNTCSIACYK